MLWYKWLAFAFAVCTLFAFVANELKNRAKSRKAVTVMSASIYVHLAKVPLVGIFLAAFLCVVTYPVDALPSFFEKLRARWSVWAEKIRALGSAGEGEDIDEVPPVGYDGGPLT